MEAAPRSDLNEDELLELDAHLSRQRARERRPVMDNDDGGRRLDLTHTRPATVDNPDVEPRSTLPGDAFRQTLLVTPTPDDQGPGQQMPLFIYHPFERKTPPILVRRREQGLGRDQGKHLELIVGRDLDSWKAELHTERPDGAGTEDRGAEQGPGLDSGPPRRRHIAVLTCDSAAALILAFSFWILWGLWLWYSKGKVGDLQHS